MKRVLPFQIFLLLFLACSDDSGNPAKPPITGPSLTASVDFEQSWTRSFEEEANEPAGVQIYRPSDSQQFPAADFRNRYVFERDGNCQWMVLHPADAHYMEPASWKLDSADPNIISIVNQLGVEVVRIRVLELRPDHMRVESLMYQVPRCNYLFGKVDVTYVAQASFADIDAVTRGFGLEYEYWSKGEVWIHVDVVSGDGHALLNQLEADPKVQDVTYGTRGPGGAQEVLYIQFDESVLTNEATAFVDSFSELRTTRVRKSQGQVRFIVPVGSESDWVAKFNREPLVQTSRVAGSMCP